MSSKSKTKKEHAKNKIANNESDTDSDNSIEENEANETSVDVGLIDDFDDSEELSSDELALSRLMLKSPFFPSKVGGKPAWLDHTNLPLPAGTPLPPSPPSDTNNNKSDCIVLQCSSCKSQLVFLLQIYAPLASNDKYLDQVEDSEKAFHRVLYVFLCNNFECGNKNFKVLRSQLSRKCDYFSYDSPPTLENGDQDLVLSKSHLLSFYRALNDMNSLNLCPVCGFRSTKKCSKCNFSFYCSQAHQLHDWTKLNHKSFCANYGPDVKDADEKIKNWINDEISDAKCKVASSAEFSFPEYEIIIEPETLDFKKSSKKDFKYDEKKIAEELESNNNDGGEDNDFDQIKENDYDKDFERFKKRSAYESTQVVRYDRGGKPLWCTKYGKLKESQIPKCEHCGSQRIFEFQVTPQLLNFLNLDVAKQIDGKSIDWAGLYVYTCIKN